MLDETYVLRYDKPVAEAAESLPGRSMEKNNRPETEEERRERVRRQRARKEVQKQRMRKKKLIRLSVYVLIGVLGVLMILAVIAIVHKVQEDRAEQAVEEAIQEEITNSEFYDPGKVLHLSFPVLSLDSAGSGLSVSQFRLILEDLYAGGYVLIDPYELADRTEKGFTAAQIMVPAGKKPLILSQHDVSYEENDTAHATALTKDASGRISCTYYDEYGSLITGAQDVVPIVEEFIESHPDFSYKGARGILGVTGYRGLLGYQVEVDETPAQTVVLDLPEEEEEDGLYDEYGMYDDGTYSDDTVYDDTVYEETADDAGMYGEDASGNLFIKEEKDKFALAADPAAQEDGSEDESEEESEIRAQEEAVSANKETVKNLLSTLRSGGWRIASNTFSVISYASSGEFVQTDAEKWNTVISPLVGSTDLLMLPYSADIGRWSGYTDSDPGYAMLRDLGFRYYFVGIEEARTWAQVRPAYVRQGMHEIEDYASYLSIMDVPADAAAAAAEDAAEEQAVEELQTNGTLELVGEALQPGDSME